MKEALDKIINEVSDRHPYKQAGNPDSYSQYNEGWSDACDIISQRLTEQLQSELSETAKVVAEKDNEIRELVDSKHYLKATMKAMDGMRRDKDALYEQLQSQLSEATAQIERLEQGMANWVRVSNERRAELNKAERRIAELEELQKSIGVISGKDAARFKQRHEASIQKIELKTPDLKGYDIDKI